MKRKYLTPLLWTVFGVLIAFPVFSMTYYTMVRTSTPEFCSSCHEIEPAYQAWKTSTHVNNPQGLVADCMDCHLPAPHDTVDFFFTKTWHGLKDIGVHLMTGGDEYDRKEQRENAYASIKSDQCLKCHRNLLSMPDQRGAMLAHRTVLYPRPGYEKQCTDCHRNLVHVDRPYYAFKQHQQPYRATGMQSLVRFDPNK
ncbi:MAG: NapC/NirT family cytochrome c [Desulfovibrionaceae bacterium]